MFLDANAHLPISPKALKMLLEFNSSIAGHGHPMSPSVAGRAAANAMEEARAKIASLLGAKNSQIFFTSTCTQACEWALAIIKNKYNGIWMSPTEHPAIKQAVKKYFSHIADLPIDENGVVQKSGNLKEPAVCVYIQNEIGIINNIDNINSSLLMSDMSQCPGKIEVNLSNMNVDIAVFGAHKFGGPAGVGFLYLKDTTLWKEFGTGSRYFMDRSGTPDVASIVAASVALEEAIETMPQRILKMQEFRDILEPGLKDFGFEIIAENANRCPNTTFVHMPNSLGITMMLALGEKNIHTGLGSACGSAYTGVSPLMERLGKGGGPHDYMRISQFGEYGAKEAKVFLDTLKKCLGN